MNLNVPPAIRAHHLVVGLEEIAGYQASVVNDLYSYRREMTMAKALQGDSVGASMVNAVVTVMTVARIGEQDAVNKLERYVEQLDEQFQGLMDEIALNDELKSEEKALVLHYSKALQFLMTGNLKWSKVCGRYNRTLVV